MKYILQGTIDDFCCVGEDSGVGVGGVPIAMWADNNLAGKNTTVRWWLADRELSDDERTDVIVQMASGVPKTEWVGVYSEVTGHLWTEEEFQIGGHDMVDIIGSRNNGKWCYIEAVTEESTCI